MSIANEKIEARLARGLAATGADSTFVDPGMLLYGVALVCLFVGGVYLSLMLFSFLVDGWSRLPQLLTPKWHQAMFGCVVLALAPLLYKLKLRRGDVYGVLEMAVAVATAIQAASSITTSPERLPSALAYLGSIYIAVRGYSNFQDHRKKLREADDYLRMVGA